MAELLQDDNMILGLSDAGAHANQLCDACYSTHLLGYWVRERGSISLEKAVHMLTQKPAELFGLEGRGVLRTGAAGDIVVFDPDTVAAGKLQRGQRPAVRRRPPDFPMPAALQRLLVNGQILRQENKYALADNGPLPGRLLRNGKAA